MYVCECAFMSVHGVYYIWLIRGKGSFAFFFFRELLCYVKIFYKKTR